VGERADIRFIGYRNPATQSAGGYFQRAEDGVLAVIDGESSETSLTPNKHPRIIGQFQMF
jgi:hypothetical protein